MFQQFIVLECFKEFLRGKNMQKWKKNPIIVEYVNIASERTTFNYDITHGIHLIRKAIQSKSIYEDKYGIKPNCIIINDTIFLRFGKYHISSFTKHLRFEGGFIPLNNINKVDIA